MVSYARQFFPTTTYLDYALAVEKITTARRNNLILNVDGCVGALSCDLLRSIGFDENQIRDFVELEALNTLFVVGRPIGLVRHISDQRRLKEGLYRHPMDDIWYQIPDEPKGGLEFRLNTND